MRVPSLCGMKTKQMHTDRPLGRKMRAMAVVALLGLAGLVHGQAEALSELAPARARAVRAPQPAPAMPSHVPVKVTDDGRQGDGRLATAQLIFALESEHPRSITVDVLDERGRVVRRRTLTAKPGRRALAMDVADLRGGRYVARIMEGEVGRVVRFHR